MIIKEVGEQDRRTRLNAFLECVIDGEGKEIVYIEVSPEDEELPYPYSYEGIDNCEWIFIGYDYAVREHGDWEKYLQGIVF